MAANHSDTEHAGVIGHVVPAWALIAVWAALMVLTIVTVAMTQVDLGSFNFHVAMAIATLKGGLVALVFMHLKWDRGFHAMVFLGALVFVFLFISIAMLDASETAPAIEELRRATGAAAGR